MAGKLESIWTKRVRRGKMDAHENVQLVAGKGIVGNTDQGGKRQVTLLSKERWEAATASLGDQVDPALRRANLLVSGVDLEESRGKTMRVGSVRIRINGETLPCNLMNQQLDGLREALKPHWGGGAYGEVLDDGEIRIGDSIAWEK